MTSNYSESALRDFGTFMQLAARKLKGSTSATDNDDCNNKLREVFLKLERHDPDRNFPSRENELWGRLKEMLWRWEGGEDIDEEERFEFHDWFGEFKEVD